MGVAAQQDARKARASKTGEVVASAMTRWHAQQLTAISIRPLSTAVEPSPDLAE